MPNSNQKALRASKTAYWQPRLDAWQASGKSVKQYCLEHGENYDQFKYWQHQLGPHTKRWHRKTKQPESIDFIEVTTNTKEQMDPISPSSPIEIKYPSGLTISVPVNISESQLSVIISSLGRLSC